MYTLGTPTYPVLDESGNPVDFSSILQQEAEYQKGIIAAQKSIEELKARVAAIYSELPQGVPAEAIERFSLGEVQALPVTPYL